MSSTLLFAGVRIDLANECVWRGEQTLKLTPTAFALLRYLVEHAGRLVTKEELLQAIWPETAVTEGVLTTHVRQIRQALEDDPKTPQFIETVHRRGYRFIAPLTTAQPVSSSKFQVSGSGSALRTPHAAIGMVGREEELAQLHMWLEKVLQGERQIERLSPAGQRMLEAASVVGAEFSAAAVAAGVGAAVEEVEEGCTELARRGQFLRPLGTA